MRRRQPKTIKLPRADQREIQRLLADGRTEQRLVRRGQVLLAMKSAKTLVSELCQQVGMTRIGIWYLCRRYEAMGLEAIYDAPRSGRPREISALERVSIEQLACSEPSGLGLEMTHWSTRSLAEIARQRGLVSHIAHSTVSLILRNADLQPHRSRYWITPTLNADFLEQAGRVLWIYERIEPLKAQNEIALRWTRSQTFRLCNESIRPNSCVLDKLNVRSLNTNDMVLSTSWPCSTCTTEKCEVAV